MDRTSATHTTYDTRPSNGAIAPSTPACAHAEALLAAEPDGLINRLHVHYAEFDERIVRTAFDIATVAHEEQRRSSGEPYLAHPVAVAHILVDLKLDPACIAAGLLHDVVEDTTFSLDQISSRCGPEIAAIVDGLTKLKAIEGRTKEDAQAGSYRKMFIAMADDPRVVLIKLADRLHNMRTLEHMPQHKQQRIARETLEIYAPLAHRLGIWQIKWELEDLSFRYLEPDKYETISRQMQLRREARERIIQRVISGLRQELDKEGIRAEITGRPKHIYSIWRKMDRKGVPLDQIYDQLAVRVLVESKDECYRVLGLVHNRWTPIPNEFDDYIAMPKESMYQSLHTTILIPGGQPCEIQIRTWEMHEVAEHGIAAHWRYKEGGLSRKAETSSDAKLQWLRNLIAWRREIDEDREFVETLKTEMLQEQVYVFTPKGRIIDLPKGATPIDFAYRIHSDVGNTCIGARVNNRQVPLHYQLENGDMVAITTTKQPRGPSRDWLEFVQTSNARNHIRRWFRRQERGLNIAAGRDMLERELKRLSVSLPFDDIAEANNYKSIEDLFAAVGVGDHHSREMVKKALGRHKAEEDVDSLAKLPETAPRQAEPTEVGIQVRGDSGVHTRLAKCCNPVEGDPIVGFVTRGKGLTIHRADCHNIVHERDRARLMDVAWGVNQAKQAYPVPIRIEAWDRVGLWRDITSTVADAGINIQAVQQVDNRHAGRATLVATLMVDSLVQLTTILDKLNRISDVIDAHRERTLVA